MVSPLEFAVRVRPPFHLQEAENISLFVDPTTDQVIVGNKYFFTADHVLPTTPSQAVVYERFSGTVRKFLEGYDVSFITFGRSKAGKTYSLVGPLTQNLCDGGQDYGIIPRAALHMFDYLSKARHTSGLNFNVFFSFFEAPNDEAVVDPHRMGDLPHRRPSMEKPMNNNFTSKECTSFEDVMNGLRLAMKNYQFDRSYHFENSHSNLFFMLTLHQQLIQAGKVYAKSSRCTFVDLGSYESCYRFGLNNRVAQHYKFSNSGLDLITRVLSSVADESSTSSQITPPYSVITALLKDILKFSSKTILLFCVSPSSMEASNSFNDLLVIERLRLLYSLPNADKKNASQDKVISNHERESFKEEALSLEFAASQWQLLVSNAESLFQKLVQGGLSADAKGQIEQWLFFKQECEDCFKHDSPGIEKIKCSLDRIDEVTESDGRTSVENSGESEPENDDDSDDLEFSSKHELTLVQSESKKREFTEKLDSHLQRFRSLTDQLVSGQQDLKSTRLFNQPKTAEVKHLCLNRKAASVESLLPTSAEGDPKAKSSAQHVNKKRDVDDSGSKIEQVNTVANIDCEDGSLRDEIASLRITKCFMNEQKRELTTKMNETKYITNEEQRKLIEADEAIDAIDSAIEFKNELLCGRNGLPSTDLQETGEQMLTDRLLKLSTHEMRILLSKYFKKVVDLREAGRKMEKVIADQDHQLEIQAFKIHALSDALQKTRVDCERRIVMVRKEQEEKYQVNFHHFATESSGASSCVDRSDSQSTSTNTGPLFELHGGASHNVTDKALTTIPQQNLRKLQGSSTHTTKVTRKGNKLIIQQERSKKK